MASAAPGRDDVIPWRVDSPNLLDWHNRQYYHRAHAINQYLASHGYVVLSFNYRLGWRGTPKKRMIKKSCFQDDCEDCSVKREKPQSRKLSTKKPTCGKR